MTHPPITDEMTVQQHPGYHKGFYDAQKGCPLFDDATPIYAAGWRGYWAARAALEAALEAALSGEKDAQKEASQVGLACAPDS